MIRAFMMVGDGVMEVVAVGGCAAVLYSELRGRHR
jgi:hypothetical protein